MGAQQALAWGYAAEIAADPLEAALDLAATLAALPPRAVMDTKRLLQASLHAGGGQAHLEMELYLQTLAGLGQEHAEAAAQARQGRAKRGSGHA